MDQWGAGSINRSIELHQQQMARIRPIRFSISQIRAMSDNEIMSIMSGEAGVEGTLYHDTLHLLSTELNRRETQRASKPHWTTIPAFILAAVAAFASVIAAIVSVVALLKAPVPVPQAHQSDSEYPSQQADLPKPPAQR